MSTPPKGWAGFGALQQVKRERAERERERSAPPSESDRQSESGPPGSDRQSESGRQPESTPPSESGRQPDLAPARSDRQSDRPPPPRRNDWQPESDRRSRTGRQPESDRQSESGRQPVLDGLELRTHYATLFNSVFDEVCPSLPPKAQLVYIQLHRLSYGHKRNWCRISNPSLARKTHQSVTVIKEAIKILVDRGLVEVDSYTFTGAQAGTLFVIPIPPGTPLDALRQSESDRRSERNRGSESDRQPESDPMKLRKKKSIETAPGAVAPAIDIFGVRTIAARLYEVHRSEPDFNRERLRTLVRDALIGQGADVGADVIEDAIGGMAVRE